MCRGTSRTRTVRRRPAQLDSLFERGDDHGDVGHRRDGTHTNTCSKRSPVTSSRAKAVSGGLPAGAGFALVGAFRAVRSGGLGGAPA